uniref:SCP domain-containing protein n=1 Tax=Angiostrongylus cantonensis TaxID=6313 RepID=A0A0K0DFD7_ANGCA
MAPLWLLITLQVFVAVDAAMCPNGDNTDEMRNIYLKYHNNARSRLAKGKENDLSRRLGPAKNIYKLSWSCELEKIAKELAQGCGYDFTRYRSYGQNRETFYGAYGVRTFDVKKHIKEALDKWWGKVKTVYVRQDNKYDPSLFEFSNMAHYKNTEIGCAHVICPDPSFSKLQVLCVYKRLGYMGDSIMWRNGKYCRTAKDCTIFPKSTCEDGLCVRPKEQPGKKSLVATGRAVDKIDKRAPKAAAMPKLQYDCALEQSASQHASWCQFSHSQGNSVGENLYIVYTPDFDKRVIAEMGTESWFEELEDYGVGKANILTQEMFHRPGQIGHYTQLVWQTTKFVGCGIKDCSSSTLVVCQYRNAGNRFGNKIYETGKPCSKCSASEQCTPTEGLCIGNA